MNTQEHTPTALQVVTTPPTSGRFVKGRSGNPSGKRKGTVSLRAAIKRALTDEDVDAIAGWLVQQAAAGDLRAVKLLLQFLPEPEPEPEPTWKSW